MEVEAKLLGEETDSIKQLVGLDPPRLGARDGDGSDFPPLAAAASTAKTPSSGARSPIGQQREEVVNADCNGPMESRTNGWHSSTTCANA